MDLQDSTIAVSDDARRPHVLQTREGPLHVFLREDLVPSTQKNGCLPMLRNPSSIHVRRHVTINTLGWPVVKGNSPEGRYIRSGAPTPSRRRPFPNTVLTASDKKSRADVVAGSSETILLSW